MPGRTDSALLVPLDPGVAGRPLTGPPCLEGRGSLWDRGRSWKPESPPTNIPAPAGPEMRLPNLDSLPAGKPHWETPLLYPSLVNLAAKVQVVGLRLGFLLLSQAKTQPAV